MDQRDQFVHFYDGGGKDDEAAEARSILFDDIDYQVADALVEGKPIQNWDRHVRVRKMSKGSLEDMPWSMPGGAPIVSDRLRILLEEHAPDQAQFLPITIKSRGKPVPGPPYWVVNWLHVVDCFDRAKSRYSTETEGGVTRYSFEFQGLVLKKSRVPRTVSVFRVKHFEEVMVMRTRLQDVLDSHGVTGIQYEPIEQV